MSNREELANRLETFIRGLPRVQEAHQTLETPESGIGYARVIHFSGGRVECELWIWNEKRFDLLPDAIEAKWLNFTSEEEFRAWAMVHYV